MATGLMGQVRSLLENEGPTARNRDYDNFASQEGKRVFRLFRLYTAVLAELDQAASSSDLRVSALRQEDGLRLVVENPRVAYRRTTLIPLELEAPFLRRLREMGLA